MNVEAWMNWNDIAALGLQSLKSNMLLFLSSPEKGPIAGKTEKELLMHLRQSGVILMHIDTPGPRKTEQKIHLLSLPISPHYFPFRLTLKYHAPVFFFASFDRTTSAGYRLRILPLGKFKSPAEGFKKYIFLLQDQIRVYPFMWGSSLIF